MSWKAFEFYSRKQIGIYPDEMSMAAALRQSYEPGARFIVENDDGSEYEAFMDSATVKIVTSPKLAVMENDEMYADPGYSYSPSE